jgi:hypothetical protein
MDNVIILADRRPKPQDPWRHAQPVLVSKAGDREELWSHPFFGISFLIWATGSNDAPEPPTTGGTPKAANVQVYQKLRAVAA